MIQICNLFALQNCDYFVKKIASLSKYENEMLRIVTSFASASILGIG